MSEAQTTPNSTVAAAGAAPAAEGGASPPAAAVTPPSVASLLAETSGEQTTSAPVAGEGGDSQAAPAGDDTLAGGAASDGLAPAPPLDPTTYNLEVPDIISVNDDLLSEARSTFAAAGVPVDKAQSLIDLYAKVTTAANTAATTAFETQNAANLTTINSMPEFQGPTRETSVQALGKLVDEYGADAKAGILSNPAVGNDPALVKFLLNVATALSEGSATPAGRPAGQSTQGKTRGQVLFGGDPATNSINDIGNRTH